MLSAILFDLDGTLVNTDLIHFQIWQEILKDYGLEIDTAFYNQRISGRTNQEIIKDILPQLTSEQGQQLAEFKEARFRNSGEKLLPLAGLPEILDWVKTAGLKPAVVTNAPRKNAEFMLAALGLNTTFPIVVLAEEAIAGKPDPAPYQLALERLGISADAAIVFEDSPSGIQSAVGAGIYTIGVASTHAPQHLLDAGASRLIWDFTDVGLWSWLQTVV